METIKIDINDEKHIAKLENLFDMAFGQIKRYGKQMLMGYPSEQFWGIWGEHKGDLKDKGVSVRKSREGIWEVLVNG